MLATLRRSAHKAASRFDRGASLPTKRTIVFLVVGNGKLDERLSFNFKINLSAASVNQRAGGNNARPSLLDDADCFQRRATCRPNVFDHQNVLLRLQREASPHGHHAASVALHNKSGHSRSLRSFWFRQRARDLL